VAGPTSRIEPNEGRIDCRVFAATGRRKRAGGETRETVCLREYAASGLSTIREREVFGTDSEYLPVMSFDELVDEAGGRCAPNR